MAKLADPNGHEKKTADAVTELVRQLLHDIAGLKVSRYQKGGSYGRRTSIYGKFDLDVLAFISEVDGKPIREFVNSGWDAFERDTAVMRRKVLERIGGSEAQVGRPGGCGLALSDDASHYAGIVQMKARGVEVDLLLLPDLAGGVSKDDVAKRQHEAVMGPLLRQLESGDSEGVRYLRWQDRAATLSLVKYVQGLPDGVKAVVRLVKVWYKYGLLDMGLVNHVTSIVLETFVLSAWYRHCQRLPLRHQVFTPHNTVDPAELLVETLRLIEGVIDGREVAMVDAGQWGYSRDVGMACQHVWGDHRVKLISPIDPTCNLAGPRRGGPRPDPNWTALAREARCLRVFIEEETFGKVLKESTLGHGVSRMCGVEPGGGEGCWGDGS